jgi:hypothetical protein
LAAPTITIIAKGMNRNPRLISTSLNTGTASWPASSTGWAHIAAAAAAPAMAKPMARRIRADTPLALAFETLA